jgi:beta-glucosidase
MVQAAYTFPAGFLWGTASAAYQYEGSNNNSTWSAWEAEPGRILNGDRSGLACDWWGGRWKEDFDRAQDSWQNAHRFSVEWSRVQPTANRWDEAAIDFYRSMARGLRERGMTPIICLHHFSEPLWLAEQGGWEWDEAPGLFNVYARKMVEALKEYCTTWLTLNEPNLFAFYANLMGQFPPGKRDLEPAFRVMCNLVRAHAAAYRSIHELQREARVSTSIHWRSVRPQRSWLPLDTLLASVFKRSFNDAFPCALVDGKLSFLNRSARFPEAAKTLDFIAGNYYTRDILGFTPSFAKIFMQRSLPLEAEKSATGFIANVPEGLFEMLNWARQFNLPIIIAENGVEDPDDRLRPRYLAEHVHQVWRAVNFNWPVKGYFHWSLVDNFEWERGWSQRFGLWGLNLATQARIRRPSVDLYAAICHENRLSSDMVASYAPEALEILFPSK